MGQKERKEQKRKEKKIEVELDVMFGKTGIHMCNKIMNIV